MTIMGDDSGPKSAYQLAMERLRKEDEEAGVERQVVTAESGGRRDQEFLRG
jgi:hypothetical protein